jgi:hypothetical protein
LYDRPDYAFWLKKFYEQRGLLGGGRWAVLQAIWYNPAGTEADFANTPKAKLYRGIQDVVTMRTDWNDPDAWFVGFKGGDNKANHGQLDIGTFVLDAFGVRWASDLGADDYNMPGYFGAQRFDYYRNNNRSHNTLVIGDKMQDPKAVCNIVEFKVSDIVTTAVCDMTAAYPGQATSVKRAVNLHKNEVAFSIWDEIVGVNEPVRWGMVTRADVTIAENGKSATLTRAEKKLHVFIVSGQVAGFEIASTTPPTEGENQNQGYKMLAVTVKPINGRVDMTVVFWNPPNRE